MTTRGKRSTGRDEADGIAAEVDMIAWEDGTYTVADVRLEGTPRRPRSESGRALLGLVHSLDNPDITGASLMVSVEFLTERIAAIEAEAAASVRAELVEKVRALQRGQSLSGGTPAEEWAFSRGFERCRDDVLAILEESG